MQTLLFTLIGLAGIVIYKLVSYIFNDRGEKPDTKMHHDMGEW